MERNYIYNLDVLEGLGKLGDDSVDCCVTSPPYWSLRDYGMNGQMGLEPTIEEYIEKMVSVFREVKRVLKPEGTLWLNMGDCYSGSGGPGGDYKNGRKGIEYGSQYLSRGLKPKDLVGMPWRIAFALQADGWWLRSDIIWSKPNPMPESVTDRPTKAHEYVFLMSKNSRYFYDADAVREEGSGRNWLACGGNLVGAGVHKANDGYRDNGEGRKGEAYGRNKRTVWEIATQPFPAAHFATFPEKLVEPCILAGTSEKGYCAECGKPWMRVVEREGMETRPGRISKFDKADDYTDGQRRKTRKEWINTTIGWKPSCTCDSTATLPGLCLDPFMGSGTVALVAHRLDRDFIGFELSKEYCDIANKRIKTEVDQQRLFI